MRTAALFLAAAVASPACGAPTAQKRDHTRPLSVQEHMLEADRHEQAASAQEALYRPPAPEEGARGPVCYDQPLAGIPYSGTEPLRVMKPCWSSDTNPTAYHLRRAAAERRAAADHRERAAQLVGAEKRACMELGEDEISHSPFFHRADIASATPYRENGQIMGATIVFRHVPGLTVTWFNRSAQCHQARAAVSGFSETFMSYCPLVLRATGFSATESDSGLRVIVRSERPEVAAAILGRSLALIPDPSLEPL